MDSAGDEEELIPVPSLDGLNEEKEGKGGTTTKSQKGLTDRIGQSASSEEGQNKLKFLAVSLSSSPFLVGIVLFLIIFTIMVKVQKLKKSNKLRLTKIKKYKQRKSLKKTSKRKKKIKKKNKKPR